MWRVSCDICEHNLATCFSIKWIWLPSILSSFYNRSIKRVRLWKCLLNVTLLHSWLKMERKTSQSNLMASKCALNIYIFFRFLLASRTSTSDFWRATFCFSETLSDADDCWATCSYTQWIMTGRGKYISSTTRRHSASHCWYLMQQKVSVWWRWNILMTRVINTCANSIWWRTIESLVIIRLKIITIQFQCLNTST